MSSLKPPPFPHLSLLYLGKAAAKFSPAPPDPDGLVEANKLNRARHAESLRARLDQIRRDRRQRWTTRGEEGAGAVENQIVIGLKMPASQLDLTFIERNFGLELISEGDDGLLLAGSRDLDFQEFEKALQLFSTGERGGGSAAGVLEIYGPGDGPRLDQILDQTLREQWPFQAEQFMILDALIEVPHNPGYLLKEKKRGTKGETREEKEARKVDWTNKATASAFERWENAKDERINQLTNFIKVNGGEILQHSEDDSDEQDGIVRFPDSVLIRVRMSGLGFRDLVMTIPWLVSLEPPAELAERDDLSESGGEGEPPETSAPPEDAPSVCVIDSGMQEGHRILRGAVRREDSQCFIPGKTPDETQDEVGPSGHGTKVAGAVLFPQGPPAEGNADAVAWLQNARILDESNRFKANQNPLKNVQDIVAIYNRGPRRTRLFVHSINARESCRRRKMSAWAALQDTHSHRDDVLFFQSAGNVAMSSADPRRLGVRQHLAAGRGYPDYLLEDSCRIAAPGQSLHAVTVGSVSSDQWWDGIRRSIADGAWRPSAFSRSGLGMWESVKPDVVELGGDFYVSGMGDVGVCTATAPQLVQSNLHGADGIGQDVGTSFAAPKVAHLAAVLQRMYPAASTQLYRALIINSARWPDWAESLPPDRRLEALRMIGYGIPQLERATENTARRVTLITENTREIINGRAMIFSVPVPLALRDSSNPCVVRIDVTLAYTSEPRPTRATRYGYLETWLSWISSNLEEPMESFVNRATKTGESGGSYTALPWMLRLRKNNGGVEGASRQNGTAQKDWAFVENVRLPNELGIAVQAHKGWNREEDGGLARFALVVSFEALNAEIPLHSLVRADLETRVDQAITI